MSETPEFAAALERFGARPALLAPGAEPLSYAELAARADERAARFGGGRRLVAIVAGPGPEPVVSYLAALRAGHVVLLVGEDPERAAPLLAVHRPDLVVRGAEIVEQGEPAPALHRELALLVPTSGSTGSAKLVRLSARNLQANAESIAGYLPIRATDRAPLMLPLQYCYGLSVLHSNLVRGAALALTGHSVADPRFWADFAELGLTSLHGVPYTFDLLDAAGFAERDLPTLRYVTQAGGRLAPEAVRRFARLGQERGWSFSVMYGQTEATARMAHLPPDRVLAAPEAVGIAVPGGSFAIEAAGPDGIGDVVYRGPNVMLGYARTRADLALGRTVDRLVTGDRGRLRPDGLLEVTGRAARFVKPFGVRLDLGEVERRIADLAPGVPAAVTGDDTGLAVAVAGPAPGLGTALAERLGLPPAAVRTAEVAELPRTPSGKVDLAAVAALAAPAVPAERAAEPVREALRPVFPGRAIADHDTFVTLGGDSLRYVQASLRLQRAVGTLPPDWPERTVAELSGLRGRARWWTRVETPVLLRAVGIVLVVASHVELFRLLGGSHVLLAVAGWSFARFALAAARPSRAALRTAAWIAVPAVVWVAWRSTVADDVAWYNALLVNYLVDPDAWGYWFVETLIQILLLVALLLAVPGVRALERRYPFGLPATLFLASLAGLLIDDPGNAFSDRIMSVHLVLWVFLLGWAAQRARTLAQRGLVVLGAAVPAPLLFGEEWTRATVVVVGIALLLVPALPVPRVLVPVLGALSAASLAIYLTHYAVMTALGALPAALVVLGCLAAGIGAHAAVVRGYGALRVRVEAAGAADLDGHGRARFRGHRVRRAAAQERAPEVQDDRRVVAVEEHLADQRGAAGA